MYVIKSNRKTNSYTVRNINRVTQVVRVGRRGLQGIQGIQGPKGDQGDPATNLVQSVNGKQGVVVLNATDVGADAAGSASQALADAKDYTDSEVGVVATDLSDHEADKSNPHEVTKAQVGLGNVDNTSDANKPISTATQTALDGKVGKVTTVNTLYGVDGSGNQTSYLISQASATSSVAQRSSGGRLAVGTPAVSAHATTKAYVDTADALKLDISDNRVELRGTGFPNGVVTASPGTYYTDTDGTNGAWRWLKKSGTGNTGWECIVGDTGWRYIVWWDSSGTIIHGSMPEGWKRATSSNSSGGVKYRRLGDTVWVQAGNIENVTENKSMGTLPYGFRPSDSFSGVTPVNTTTISSISFRRYTVNSAGNLVPLIPSGSVIGQYNTPSGFNIPHTTEQGWPTA